MWKCVNYKDKDNDNCSAEDDDYVNDNGDEDEDYVDNNYYEDDDGDDGNDFSLLAVHLNTS